MNDITIRTIPQESQRYKTVGDYWEDVDGLQVRISDINNEDFEFLTMIHELIEQHLTKRKGISEADITDFDIKFEQFRETNPELIGKQEPGDMITSPYYEEHQFATMIERMIANKMGINWRDYDKNLSSL